MVNDINIRPSDIVEQLALLPEMTFEKACQLLDPPDKQNVPKAVTLLQSLLQIKHLLTSPDPSINRRQISISFVAEIFGYFLQPFITVDMSLSDQVQCLATYSFLANVNMNVIVNKQLIQILNDPQRPSRHNGN
jgi:hypothetical protein